MKNLFIFVLLLCCGYYSAKAQLFVGRGDLKIGLEVTKEGKLLSIDSLCSGFDAETKVPINLVIPEGSSVSFDYDSMKVENMALYINNEEPKYYQRTAKTKGGFIFSRSASAGAKNSFSFIDEKTNDTLTIAWKVGYSPIQLIDLCPADEFTEFIAFQIQNLFEKYPDSARYNWAEVEYIAELDTRGIPVEPVFPHNENGFYFIADKVTENAVVQLKGYHDIPQPINENDPYKLFLYEDLEPGSYEFIVKPYADAPERLWLQYPFTIKKPWWLTGRFQLFFGMAISIGLVLVVVFVILTIKNRKEKELRWKQQITDAELKAIRAQLNPHFLFNSLNSIQNLVAKQQNEQANVYITKLSRLLRQVLSSSEHQFQELQDELKLTQLYLEIEQLRFPFTFEIHVEDSVEKQSLVPVMLLQPYAENAVKHGVSGKADGVIIINIKENAGKLAIEIIDNGPGLSQPNGNSKGLSLSQDRITHLNKVYADEATVAITNRDDASGVKVHLSLPVE